MAGLIARAAGCAWLVLALGATACSSAASDSAEPPVTSTAAASAIAAATPEQAEFNTSQSAGVPTATPGPLGDVSPERPAPIPFPEEFNLINELAASATRLGFAGGAPLRADGGITFIETPTDEWDLRPPFALTLSSNGGPISEGAQTIDVRGIDVFVETDRRWFDCRTVWVSVATVDPDGWPADELDELAWELARDDCGRDFDPGQTLDPGSKARLVDDLFTYRPTATWESGQRFVYSTALQSWNQDPSECAAPELIGYDVIAAESGEIPIFDPDPSGLLADAVSLGSVAQVVMDAMVDATAAEQTGYVVTVCGSQLSVTELAFDDDGRLESTRIVVADFEVDGNVGVAVLAGSQDLSIEIWQYGSQSTVAQASVDLTTGVVSLGQAQPSEQWPAVATAPDSHIRFAGANVPGYPEGPTAKWTVDATNDGIDNFVDATFSELRPHFVAPIVFGPDNTMVWSNQTEAGSAIYAARYLDTGQIVDLHGIEIESSSVFAPGIVHAAVLSVDDDGLVHAYGSMHAPNHAGGSGPRLPNHGTFDLTTDPGFLQSGANPADIDADPVVELGDWAAWHVGTDTYLAPDPATCQGNTLYQSTPGGYERLLPVGTPLLGEVVAVTLGPESIWTDSNQTERPGQWVALEVACPADSPDHQLVVASATERGAWFVALPCAISEVLRFGVPMDEYSVPPLHVAATDGSDIELDADDFVSLSDYRPELCAGTNAPNDLAVLPPSLPLDFAYLADPLQPLGFTLESASGSPPHATVVLTSGPATASLEVTSLPWRSVSFTEGWIVRSSEGVPIFEPSTNATGGPTKTVATWCGSDRITLTSVGGQGAPYDVDQLESFAKAIARSCSAAD